MINLRKDFPLSHYKIIPLLLVLFLIIAGCGGGGGNPLGGGGGGTGDGGGTGGGGNTVDQIPVASDFTVDNLSQVLANLGPVTIVSKPGKSSGAVTIKYNGIPSLPANPGQYNITFNVGKAPGWEAAIDLYIGDLIVNEEMFDDIPAFAAWLAAKNPPNSPTTPFFVKLNLDSHGGSSVTSDSLGHALNTNFNKYVNLDMLDAGITSITSVAFENCSTLTGIYIPSTITFIANNAFTKCGYLTTIYVDPANADYTAVNNVLYSKDKKLLHAYPGGKTDDPFTIPGSVTTIEESAFVNCERLVAVIIPASVTTIKNMAFENCHNLTSVTFKGESVYFDGPDAFPDGLRDVYSGKGEYTKVGGVWVKQ